MTDEHGAFFSALDAETNSEEGRYYVWQREEVEKILSPEEFALWADVYGISGEPNFEERYIPLLAASLAESAKKRGLTEDQLNAKLQPIRQKLLAERAKRPRPLTDTKILTGWNGLMIGSLAEAGRVFKNESYVAAAAKAADFLLAHLRDEQGNLLRTYAAGQAKIPAYLDDYAFLVDGLLALHQASGNDRWLQAADELTQLQLKLFWDQRVGGFFFTSTLHEQLIARSKLPTDTVTPSGNSVSASNLLYLATALDKREYVDRTEKCIQAAGPLLDEHASAVPQLALALSQWIDMTQKDGSKAPDNK
jgi:uncharacterized protein YyaL (SSP411 family)